MNNDNFNTFEEDDSRVTRLATSPNGGEEKKSNNAAIAGGIAAAAVIGGGATAAAMTLGGNHDDDEEVEVEITDENGEVIPELTELIDDLAGVAGAHYSQPQPQPQPGVNQTVNVQPPVTPEEPIGPQNGGGEVPANGGGGENPANGGGGEGPANGGGGEGPANGGGGEGPANGGDAPAPINPEEILSVTEVDSDDNDIPEVVGFDNGVEVVAQENGEVAYVAEFSTEGGNGLMVDVDADGVFDMVTDGSGQNLGSAGGTMVSDIELMQHENDTEYLAANELDNNSDVSGTGEAAADDVIII